MEQQFILRLHESIKNEVDLKNSTLEVCNEKSVVLSYGGQKYPGIIVRLPCIVESQKTMDNRQHYKVADISTLVVVYPHGDFDFEREREIHELSGLCPPLKYAKARRFRKKNSKIEYVEEIEKKVGELLEKDMRARLVEVITKEEKETSDDLDMLAAEIEKKLVDYSEARSEESKIPFAETKHEKEEKPKNQELERLEKSVEEKRKQMESALNPILQKRFELQLEVLLKELEAMKKSLGEE
ncbi:TATA-binding protein-associated factor [Encephalitozoon intestinalis ATCC 50506]|uniref:TATA-binding protein-associated factor n=1 Tax=Encephalitozoon intestinalis (strain ATCC 50506) TaxID=876142 RepID=E0S774_ENCIT|nr:TATA-binding protein-associated factor [Encephalitozoon intestinalis ATCC 50506]ADM11502.1 TATA-binding protein-associated factor [Encephalitozoon intestinalis ATCC 50506]UTX45215.1 TATA-binding protein-associated factor 7 [Encephalitozoon intestinalis]